MLRYFDFKPSFKLRCCRARDLFKPQIPVATGGFEMRIPWTQSSYLRGLGDYFACKRFAFETLLWSLDF